MHRIVIEFVDERFGDMPALGERDRLEAIATEIAEGVLDLKAAGVRGLTLYERSAEPVRMYPAGRATLRVVGGRDAT